MTMMTTCEKMVKHVTCTCTLFAIVLGSLFCFFFGVASIYYPSRDAKTYFIGETSIEFSSGKLGGLNNRVTDLWRQSLSDHDVELWSFDPAMPVVRANHTIFIQEPNIPPFSIPYGKQWRQQSYLLTANSSVEFQLNCSSPVHLCITSQDKLTYWKENVNNCRNPNRQFCLDTWEHTSYVRSRNLSFSVDREMKLYWLVASTGIDHPYFCSSKFDSTTGEARITPSDPSVTCTLSTRVYYRPILPQPSSTLLCRLNRKSTDCFTDYAGGDHGVLVRTPTTSDRNNRVTSSSSIPIPANDEDLLANSEYGYKIQ